MATECTPDIFGFEAAAFLTSSCATSLKAFTRFDATLA